MAKAKSITVSLGLTLNLGNYESARFDAGIELELEPKDKAETVYAQAWKALEKQVEIKAREIRGENFFLSSVGGEKK